MTLYIVYSLAKTGERQPHTIDIAQAGQVITTPPDCDIVFHASYTSHDVAKVDKARLMQLHGFQHRPSSPMRYKRTGIKCTTDGKLYKNASAAARAYKLSNGAVSLHLNYPTRYPNAGGYTFQRIV